MTQVADIFIFRKRIGPLSKQETDKLIGTDVYKCRGCNTIYRAKKPGCPRDHGPCKSAIQVPTTRYSG